MAKVPFTIDENTIAHMIETRDFHLQEAQKIDNALAVFRSISAKIVKVTASIKGAKSRAAQHGHQTSGQPTAKEWVQQHADLTTASPKQEIERLSTLATQHGYRIAAPGLQAAFYVVRSEKGVSKVRAERGSKPKAQTKTKAQTKWQAQYALKKSGDTPINRVRQVFQEESGPLSADAVIQKSKLHEVLLGKPSYTPNVAARVLAKMTVDKELKHTKDGWVAYKVKPPVTVANDNGARA